MAHDGAAAMIRLNERQWYDYHFESMRLAAAGLPADPILPTAGSQSSVSKARL